MIAKDVPLGICMRVSKFGGTIHRAGNERKSQVRAKLEYREVIKDKVIPGRSSGTNVDRENVTFDRGINLQEISDDSITSIHVNRLRPYSNRFRYLLV